MLFNRKYKRKSDNFSKCQKTEEKGRIKRQGTMLMCSIFFIKKEEIGEREQYNGKR